MSASVPNQVDPFRLAGRAERIEGRLSLTRAERLAELAARPPGEGEVRLLFSRDAYGMIRVEGEVRTRLWLQCQRCLEPFQCDLEAHVDLVLVETDAEAERLLEQGRESALIENDRLDLLELAEEELLLAMPLIPMHPSAEDCSPEARDLLSATDHDEPPQDEGGSSPFAVLAGLKKTD